MKTIRKSIVFMMFMIVMGVMSILSIASAAKPPQPPAPDRNQCYVYMAAGLFSTTQTDFNSLLEPFIANQPDKNNIKFHTGYSHNTFLPQRDGFVFPVVKSKLIQKGLSELDAINATYIIIYYLDVGYFVPKSNVVIGLLDEPIDPGVVVEHVNAKLMTKPVIQYKTDVLSPFGEYGEPLGGIHFFPPFNSSVFMLARLQPVDTIANRLNTFINTAIDKQFATIPGYDCSKNAWNISPDVVKNNPVFKDLLQGADILFDNVVVDQNGNLLPSGSMNNPIYYKDFIKAIHTDVGLGRVAQHYIDAIAANPDHPELVFKAYPLISPD